MKRIHETGVYHIFQTCPNESSHFLSTCCASGTEILSFSQSCCHSPSFLIHYALFQQISEKSYYSYFTDEKTEDQGDLVTSQRSCRKCCRQDFNSGFSHLLFTVFLIYWEISILTPGDGNIGQKDPRFLPNP